MDSGAAIARDDVAPIGLVGAYDIAVPAVDEYTILVVAHGRPAIVADTDVVAQNGVGIRSRTATHEGQAIGPIGGDDVVDHGIAGGRLDFYSAAQITQGRVTG